jgi:hypothetical protein
LLRRGQELKEEVKEEVKEATNYALRAHRWAAILLAGTYRSVVPHTQVTYVALHQVPA